MRVHSRVQVAPGVPQMENLVLWYHSEGSVTGERGLLANTRRSASW